MPRNRGEPATSSRPVAEPGRIEIVLASGRRYNVFNVEQIEGLPEHYYAKPAPRTEVVVQRIERVESFFAATGATVRQGGNLAYYSVSTDHVQMLPIESFR